MTLAPTLLALLLAPEAAPPPRLAPDLRPLVKEQRSAMADVARRYEVDRDSLQRTYPILASPTRHARMEQFHAAWLVALEKLPSDKLSTEAKNELVALQKVVTRDRDEVAEQAKDSADLAPLLPFGPVLMALEETRRRMELVDPVRAAGQLTKLTKEIGKLQKEASPSARDARRAEAALGRLRGHFRAWFDFYNSYDPLFSWWLAEPYKEADEALGRYVAFLRERAKSDKPDAQARDSKEPAAQARVLNPLLAPRAPTDVPDLAAILAAPRSELETVIRRFQGDRFRRGRLAGAGLAPPTPRSARYHQEWLDALTKLDFDALSLDGQIDYLLLRNHLQRELARTSLPQSRPTRPRDPTAITGRPIGREALLLELKHEMIPYTPEELVAIAEREFAWCDAEMKKATRDMGMTDWRQALEKVKTLHVEPGKQPALIRDLAHEAIAYLRKNDLVSLPLLAVETWRMEMMSPRRQLVNPFFTGGEVISVSFPTSTMPHDAKLQSLRGNNVHFSRATVHHELIPGHHLQGFLNARNKPYRGLFGTPFWLEGWALYWEFVLYDKGFPMKPEDRVGFLFWRMHRCARILFSLGFHLGTMTPEQCIDLLVTRVGHERENATAEVRRSFAGNYGPLYQAAYMLGGLQFRALREEFVGSGKMTERAFHDAILAENRMPIALVRARLQGQKLSRDGVAAWKFAGALEK